MQFDDAAVGRSRNTFDGAILLTCMIAMFLVAMPLRGAPPIGASAASGDRIPSPDALEFAFSIPDGPLDAALKEYGHVTGIAVLVDDSLLVNRRASGVEGVFSARGALGRMLEGTGLSPRFVSGDAFTLELSTNHADGTAASIPAVGVVEHDRVMRVQRSVESVLCATSVARPGDYRAAIQLWFGTRGDVERVSLLDSTGLPERDRVIGGALMGLRLEDPGLRALSPVTLLILPVQPGFHSPCPKDMAR